MAEEDVNGPAVGSPRPIVHDHIMDQAEALIMAAGTLAYRDDIWPKNLDRLVPQDRMKLALQAIHIAAAGMDAKR